MGRWVDISMAVTDGLRTNHSRPGEEVRITFDVKPDDTPQRKTVRRISTRLHIGTHVDAPEHLVEGAQSLNEIAIDRFVGPALVADFSHKVPGGVIRAADLEAALSTKIKKDDIVILRTGWNSRYAEPDFFDNSPTFSLDAADWFVAHGTKMVAVDFLCDPLPPNTENGKPDPAKTKLLAGGVLVMTNADHLDQITRERVTLYAFPIKVVPAEAAPTRAVVWED